MSNQPVDVAIIGAGPYGLSLAAHLDAAGVDYRIFGVPMESWCRHMPPGMRLQSDPVASSLFDPARTLTLQQFCRERHIDYHPYEVPVRLEDFIAYGRAFQQRFVPRVELRRLLALQARSAHFHLRFERGESLLARRVVLAVGTAPFRHVPARLAGLPAALASHSGEYGSLDRLLGKEVLVVGAGCSALDLAALLSSRGSSVTLLAREARLNFPPRPGSERAPWGRRTWQRLLSPASSGLGNGWLMRVCADAPQLLHCLPDGLRARLLARTLRPSSGTRFVRDQVHRNVVLRLGRVLERIEERGGRLLLTTADRDGTRELLRCEHLIAATGYRVDLRRLDFLDRRLLTSLHTVEHAPVLSANFESSVPGLYFVGPAAARSFGPVSRFVQGAIHPARRLASHLPASLVRGYVPVPAMLRDTTHTPA